MSRAIELTEKLGLDEDARFAAKLAKNKGADPKIVDKAKKVASRGSLMDRYLGIAKLSGDKRDLKVFSALKSFLDAYEKAFGGKPGGMQKVMDEIGSLMAFGLVINGEWTKDQIDDIAWGLPSDFLMQYGFERK